MCGGDAVPGVAKIFGDDPADALGATSDQHNARFLHGHNLSHPRRPAREGDGVTQGTVGGQNYAETVPANKPESDRTLITSAGRSRTLDIDERNKRYLITMVLRTACFIAFLVVPGWWKVAALVGAAILPAFAVLFANATDNRPPPLASPEPEEETGRLALPSQQVIEGDIEEDVA
ncbi:DUF3099 domain-containing protein [Tessaracoccus antarcticus]|uniref:DUF3099 domain-containing protein n=1 Tax=Tessaracoccus antarcticus TaxID=2479848 RepID=A0A3M0G6Z2_9ACTN|nr:DUF3099 domain-containing protein [Tessaracoccus antarcticus]